MLALHIAIGGYLALWIDLEGQFKDSQLFDHCTSSSPSTSKSQMKMNAGLVAGSTGAAHTQCSLRVAATKTRAFIIATTPSGHRSKFGQHIHHVIVGHWLLGIRCCSVIMLLASSSAARESNLSGWRSSNVMCRSIFPMWPAHLSISC
jgi:hypothetical protein